MLDQLLGGAGPDGVTYDVATNLLGYTPDNLLDEVVDAFAAVDGAGVFGVVDKVIETGQDPRRFTEDVLRRLRDLVIVAAVPDAPATGLIDAPEDQAERLVAQAARFGKAELVRAADIVAAGLTEMRGATTPRLLLELICARVLLPAVGRRLARARRAAGSSRAAASVPVGPAAPPAPAAGATARSQPLRRRLRRGGRASPIHAPSARPRRPRRRDAAPVTARSPGGRAASRSAEPARPAASPRQPAAHGRSGPAAAEPSGQEARRRPVVLSLADVRRIWPDLLEPVKKMRRFTWILLSQNAQVIGVDATSLTVGFKTAGARDSFIGGRQRGDPAPGGDRHDRGRLEDRDRGRPVGPAGAGDGAAGDPAGGRRTAPGADRGASRVPAPTGPPTRDRRRRSRPARAGRARPAGPAGDDRGGAVQHRPTRRGDEPAQPTGPDLDADAHRDDPAAEDNGLDSTELLERELGATVIEEIPHD